MKLIAAVRRFFCGDSCDQCLSTLVDEVDGVLVPEKLTPLNGLLNNRTSWTNGDAFSECWTGKFIRISRDTRRTPRNKLLFCCLFLDQCLHCLSNEQKFFTSSADSNYSGRSLLHSQFRIQKVSLTGRNYRLGCLYTLTTCQPAEQACAQDATCFSAAIQLPLLMLISFEWNCLQVCRTSAIDSAIIAVVLGRTCRRFKKATFRLFCLVKQCLVTLQTTSGLFAHTRLSPRKI